MIGKTTDSLLLSKVGDVGIGVESEGSGMLTLIEVVLNPSGGCHGRVQPTLEILRGRPTGIGGY